LNRPSQFESSLARIKIIFGESECITVQYIYTATVQTTGRIV